MTLSVADILFDTETDADFSLLAITPIEGTGISNTGEISVLVDGKDRKSLQARQFSGLGATATLWNKEKEGDNWEQMRHFIAVVHASNLVDNQVEIVLRSKYAHLLEAEPVRWNADDHKRRHPGDTCFDYLAELERTGREIKI